MSVNATLKASLAFQQSGSSDVAAQRFDGVVEQVLQLASGTGAQQSDILFVDERTVASDTDDDLDLAGVLAGAFGAVITAVEVVAVLLINRPISDEAEANTTDLTMGAATAPVPALAAGPIGPGGFIFLADPDAGGLATVTPTTADVLRISNSAGAAATYQIAILGRSA